MKRYEGVQLAQFHSGKLHNAIPRDGYFVIAVPNELKENVRADWNVFAADVQDEFHVTDPQMVFSMESTDAETVIDPAVAKRFVWAVQAVDNGVYAICQDEALGGMVETSSNIASIHSADTTIDVLSSQRSNVMSNLDNMCATIQAVFQLAGAEAYSSDGYPAWKMKADSKLTAIVVESYKKLFGKEPVVRGIHAGLECGLFSERYPQLDMVSFGPYPALCAYTRRTSSHPNGTDGVGSSARRAQKHSAEMNPSRAYIIIGVLTLLLLASCGQQYKAKGLVKDFVREICQLRRGNITDFSDLDSTRVISDSLVQAFAKD